MLFSFEFVILIKLLFGKLLIRLFLFSILLGKIVISEFTLFWFIVFVPIKLFLKTVEEVLDISDAVDSLLLCPCGSINFLFNNL